MEESSAALTKLLYDYAHLPLGGKEIRCPYWMNDLKAGVFGPFGGKGLPEQIVAATEEEARKAGRDLNQMSETEILAFMEEKRIGLDCSGLAFALLNTLDQEKGGNGIIDDIPDCQGRFLCRASVVMLTDEAVALPIEKLDEVKVGDMIRLRGGKHIAVVIKVNREEGVIKEIEYAHSSDLTAEKGIHTAKIQIASPQGRLEDQVWEEKTADGQDYGQSTFSPTMGDGIKRLKIWA